MKSQHKPQYRERLRRLRRLLGQQQLSCALVLGSAAPLPASRDSYFPFRQHSDFYYLTGSLGKDLLLFVSSTRKAPLVMIAPPPDKHKLLWDGRDEHPSRLAAALGAELIVSKTPESEVMRLLKGHELLLFQNEPHSRAWSIAKRLIELPSHQRRELPAKFFHADVVMEPLRLHKQPDEIRVIREAGAITSAALFECLDWVSPRFTEKQVQLALESYFRAHGCDPAFPTIVACGRNAATLHHHSSDRRLKRGELVLIDLGAQKEMYASDISRTIPVGGTFRGIQQVLYEIVLEAQRRALAQVKHGALVRKVYEAAARTIIEGLKEVGVLKGRTSALLSKQAHKPYFPHSIGHSLGLDVHDIGNLREYFDSRLESGMVVTIEPGLYFQKAIRKVPACGIRIEDDVLVTSRGNEILTPEFPKAPHELMKLLPH